MPNIGCLVGTAYQNLVGGTQEALRAAGLDITVAEYMILRTLYDADGLQQCEISTAVGKDKAATCRTVSSLQKKGYVATQTISRKCLKVWLTAAALELKPAIMEVAAKRQAEMDGLATREELEIFRRVLEAIIKN